MLRFFLGCFNRSPKEDLPEDLLNVELPSYETEEPATLVVKTFMRLLLALSQQGSAGIIREQCLQLLQQATPLVEDMQIADLTVAPNKMLIIRWGCKEEHYVTPTPVFLEMQVQYGTNGAVAPYSLSMDVKLNTIGEFFGIRSSEFSIELVVKHGCSPVTFSVRSPAIDEPCKGGRAVMEREYSLRTDDTQSFSWEHSGQLQASGITKVG